MALDPILWAMKSAPVANVEEWALLVCLSDHANADGTAAYPSQPTMAGRTRTSIPTVKRRIAAMEKRGLIRRGDQSLVVHLPADKRPVVWDLMIPLSWFPDLADIQEGRASRGMPPLTVSDRPDLAPAPEKARRVDAKPPKSDGSTRAGGLEDPGVLQSGGSSSSERGVSEVGAGGLEDPQTSPTNPHLEPPPAAPARAAATGASTTGASKARPSRAKKKVDPDMEEHLTRARDIVTRYMTWWAAEKGSPILKSKSMFFALVESYVAPALKAGHPERHVIDCLAQSARDGYEWPDESAWRRRLDGNIRSGRPSDTPRSGHGVWGRMVTQPSILDQEPSKEMA